MPTPLRVVMGLLVLNIVAITVLFWTGYRDAASLLGNLGTFFIMAGAVLYIVFLDPRKRWPGVSAWQRFTRVMTFDRGER